MFERGGFVREREQEIHAADLRITEMVAGFAILPIMPADAVFGKEIHRLTADAGIQVLFCELGRQAEGVWLAFIDSIRTGSW
jgi:hypothetical protein